MTRDERRLAAAGRLLGLHVTRMKRDIEKIRGMTGTDGKPLARRQFLSMAERHAEMAATYAASACAPPTKREG